MSDDSLPIYYVLSSDYDRIRAELAAANLKLDALTAKHEIMSADKSAVKCAKLYVKVNEANEVMSAALDEHNAADARYTRMIKDSHKLLSKELDDYVAKVRRAQYEHNHDGNITKSRDIINSARTAFLNTVGSTLTRLEETSATVEKTNAKLASVTEIHQDLTDELNELMDLINGKS